jgi:hypothetical protein
MIWDILFPGIKRPPSPYLFSLVEETISRVRLFWERQQTPIISSVLGIRSDSNAVTPEMVAHVVNEVLARFAHSQQPTSTHDDSSPEKNVSPLPSCIPNMQDIDTADSGSIWDLDVNDMPLPGQLGPVRFDSIDSGIGSQFDLDETLQNYGNI